MATNIQDAFAEGQDLLSNLENYLDSLENRLSCAVPVEQPAVGEKAQVDTTPPGAGESPLVQTQMDMNQRLRRANLRLTTLLDQMTL